MTHIQIDVPRTPEEVAAALQMQRIAACPIRSRLMWSAAFLCAAALMIPLPRRWLMASLPYAGIYASSGNFDVWRLGWASYEPPHETISADERKRFLSAIADILER